MENRDEGRVKCFLSGLVCSTSVWLTLGPVSLGFCYPSLLICLNTSLGKTGGGNRTFKPEVERMVGTRHSILIAFISPKSCLVEKEADLFCVTQGTEPRPGDRSFWEAVSVYEEEEFPASQSCSACRWTTFCAREFTSPRRIQASVILWGYFGRKSSRRWDVDQSHIFGESPKLIPQTSLIVCFSLKVNPIDVMYLQINGGFSEPPLEIMSRNSLLNLCRCTAGDRLNCAG